LEAVAKPFSYVLIELFLCCVTPAEAGVQLLYAGFPLSREFCLPGEDRTEYRND